MAAASPLLLLLLLTVLPACCATGVVHLDIEPHSLAEWKTDRSDIASQWLTLVGDVNKRLAATPSLSLTLTGEWVLRAYNCTFRERLECNPLQSRLWAPPTS